MKLSVTPVEKALNQLEKSLHFLDSPLSQNNADMREQFRAASIQAFEFTYELIVKMIRRQLEQSALAPQEIRELDFMQLMRTAQDSGLIRDSLQFRSYREMRNITSHSYDEEKAEQIVNGLHVFVADAHFVLENLKKRNV